MSNLGTGAVLGLGYRDLSFCFEQNMLIMCVFLVENHRFEGMRVLIGSWALAERLDIWPVRLGKIRRSPTSKERMQSRGTCFHHPDRVECGYRCRATMIPPVYS